MSMKRVFSNKCFEKRVDAYTLKSRQSSGCMFLISVYLSVLILLQASFNIENGVA